MLYWLNVHLVAGRFGGGTFIYLWSNMCELMNGPDCDPLDCHRTWTRRSVDRLPSGSGLTWLLARPTSERTSGHPATLGAKLARHLSTVFVRLHARRSMCKSELFGLSRTTSTHVKIILKFNGRSLFNYCLSAGFEANKKDRTCLRNRHCLAGVCGGSPRGQSALCLGLRSLFRLFWSKRLGKRLH